uniref:Uncharacterized protein n=1 Tax=Rhodnius prolixus TaxID=13249 RepID=T1HFA6_RHOPR
MRSRPLNTCLICMCFLIYSSALPRAKDYRPKSSEYVSGPGNVANAASTQSIGTYSKEPSCEELRAMWRFSKRQSRAAEVTNEIPTYRDPFAFNVWEEYGARPRSAGRGFGRYRKPPVYGKIIIQKKELPLFCQIRNYGLFMGKVIRVCAKKVKLEKFPKHCVMADLKKKILINKMSGFIRKDI